MVHPSVKEAMEAFQRDPKNVPLFNNVCDVLSQSNLWAELLDLYEVAAREAEPRRAEDLLFEAGEISETRSQDLDRAARFYEQSFFKRNKSGKALRALRALEESRKNHNGVLRALRFQLDIVTEPTRRARLHAEIAALYQDHLNEHDKAIDAYTQALDEDPKNKETLIKLENLCRRKKRWAPLVHIYKKLAIRLKGSRDAGFYHFCAALVFDEQQKDPRNAEVAFGFALKNGISDLKKLERIRSFAVIHKKDELLLQVLSQGSSKSRSQSDRHRMRLDMANIYSKRLEDPKSFDKAEDEVQSVLAENPRSRKAVELLEKLYQQSDPGHAAWLALYQHKITHLDLPAKERLLCFSKLAEFREEKSDYQGALAAFRSALTSDKKHRASLLGVARISRQIQDWPNYIESLSSLTQNLKPDKDPEQRALYIDVQKQRAWFFQHQEEDLTAENQALTACLKYLPGDEELLSRLMALADGLGELDEWGRLLEHQAKLALNQEQRLALFKRLATFREDAIGDLHGAAEAWEVLDQGNSDRPLALEHLERIYQSLKKYEELATVYRRQSHTLPEPAQKAVALRKLGCLQRDHLDSPSQAAQNLRGAWAIDPEAENILNTLEELLKAEEESGDHPDKLWVLQKISRHVSDENRQASIRRELIAANIACGKHKEALVQLDSLLGEDPSDQEAFEQLIHVLEKEDRLLEVWSFFKSSLLINTDKVLGITRRLGSLYQEKLKGKDQKPLLKLWKHTVEILPGNEEAARAYVEVARSFKAPEQRNALESLIDFTQGNEEHILQTELGRLHREQSQLDLAQKSFRRAYEIDPAKQESLDSLRSVLALLGNHEELLRLLQDAARRLRDQYKKAKELEAKDQPKDKTTKEISPNIADRIRRLELDAAELAEDKLKDPTRALLLLEDCYKSFSNLEVVERLAALYRQLDRKQELSQILGELADLSGDAETRCLTLLEKAKLNEESLGDPMEALLSYNKAIEENPKNGDLWLTRATVRERLGQWKEALMDLSKGAELNGAYKSGLAAVERRRARIYRDHCHDQDEEAEACLKQARSADPDDYQNHQLLVDFYERRDLYPQLQEALSSAAYHAQDHDLRATLLARRGEVLICHLGKAKTGLKVLNEALELCPKDLALMDRKIQILRHAKDPEILAQALADRRNAFSSLADDRQRVRRGFLLREEGLLRAWELGDFEQGLNLLAEAVSLCPERFEWIEDSLLLERHSDNWKRRLNLLKRAADRVRRTDPKHTAVYLMEAGIVCFQKLDDTDRARRFFNAVLAADSEAYEALHWLQIIASEKNDTAGLIGALNKEHEIREGPEKDRLALRIGEIQQDAGDLEKARKWLEKASNSGSKRALRRLHEVLFGLKDASALFESTLRLAQAEQSAQRRRVELLRLGENLVQLDDKQRAGQAYRTILKSFPEDIRSLRALAQLLDPKKDTKELIQLQERELEAGVGPARYVELQMGLGEIRWLQLEDAQAARVNFEAILERNFSNEPVRSLLKECYIDLHDWSALAKHYERVGHATTLSPKKEEAFRQAAMLYHHHEPQDLNKAKELYLKVLEFGDPQCLAIDALPPLIAENGTKEENRQLMTLTAQIVPGSSRAQKALIELGRECSIQQDHEQAIVFWSRALGWSAGQEPRTDTSLTREEGKALELILNLERKNERWKEVSEYLGLKAQTTSLSEARRIALLEQGMILRDDLKQELQALEVFEKVFEEHPDDELAIKSLRKLYQRFSKNAELSRMLRRAADHASTEVKRCDFLLEKVKVDEECGELRGAIECLRRVTSYNSENIELRQKLVALQREAGDDIRVLVTLDELAQLVEGEQRLGVYLQKAIVLDENLNRSREASELLERILEELPKKESSGARELVEKLKDLADKLHDDRPALLARETEYLWLLLKAKNNKDDLELRKEVEAKGTKVGRLHVSNDNLTLAESWIEQGLEVYPDSMALFSSLRTVVEASGLGLRLFDVIDRRCEVCEAKEEIELRGDLAELFEEHLEDPVQAIVQWQRVLEICPGSLSALRSLQRLSWSLNHQIEALDICEKELEYLERLGPEAWTGAIIESKVNNRTALEERLNKAFGKHGQKARHYDLKALLFDTAGYPEEDVTALAACLVYDQLSDESLIKPKLPARFGDYVSRIYRKAAIIARGLDELDRAAKYLERALFLVPADEMISLQLVEVHELRKDWEALATIHRARWVTVDNPAERHSVGLRLADLEQKRGETEAAVRVLESLWQDSEGDLEVLLRMKAIQQRLGDHAALVKTLRWEAEQATRIADEAALWLHRGRLQDYQLSNREGAIADYQRVQKLEPGEEQSRVRLCELYKESGDYENLVDLLSISARLRQKSENSVRFYEEAAELTWTKLDDGPRALSFIESAIALGSEKAELFDRQVEIERQRNDGAALSKALQRQAQQLAGVAKSAVLLEAAKLQLRVDPVQAAMFLEDVLSQCSVESDESKQALSLLVDARRAQGEDKLLLSSLERQLRDKNLEDTKRLDLLHECAALADNLGLEYKSHGAQALEEMLKLTDNKIEVLGRLIHLHKAQPSKRLRWIDRILECELESDDEERYLRLVVELSTGVSHDPERTIAAYQRLFKLRPKDHDVLLGLLTTIEREGRHADVIELIDKEIGKFSNSKEDQRALVALQLRRARIYEEVLFDLDSAHESYGQAFEGFKGQGCGPLHDKVLNAYEAFLRRRGRFESLAEILEERVQNVEETGQKKEAQSLWRELAAIYQGTLEDSKRAVRCFERLLVLDSKDAQALYGIQRPLRFLGHWKRLEEVMEQALPLEEDLERRAWKSYVRGVILEEELDRLEDAMESYELALYVDSLNIAAIRRLKVIYEQRKDYDELCRICDLESRALKDKGARASVLCRLGDICGGHLESYEQAEDYYRQALELEPQFSRAYEGLILLLRAAERFGLLAKTLGEYAQILPKSKRYKDVLIEQATILETELEGLEVAAESWDALLEEYQQDRRILEGALACKRQLKDWVGLAELVEGALAGNYGSREGDPYEHMMEAASALEKMHVTGDGDARSRAIHFAQGAFAAAPSRPEAVELLRRLYEKKERRTLMKVLGRHAQNIDDKGQALLLYREAGQIALDSEDEKAIEMSFVAVLEIAPDDFEAVKALEVAATVKGDWPAVAAWIEKQLVLGDEVDRKDLFTRLGVVREKLGEKAQAISAFESALDLSDPDHAFEVIEKLLPCVRGLERWDDLVALLRRGAECTESGTEQWRSFLLERAQILRDELKRPDLAADAYEDLISSDLPEDLRPEIFEKLCDLLQQLGLFSRLKKVLLQQAEHLGSEAAPLWLQLGQLAEGPLNAPEAALVFYRKSHELAPANLDSLAHLKEMLYTEQRWDDLLRVIKSSVQKLENIEHIYELQMECGALAEDNLGDTQQALRFYFAACRLGLCHKEAFEYLARVQEQCHQYRDLVSTLEGLKDLYQKPEDKRLVLKRMARIYKNALQQQDKALEIYSAILEENAEDSEVLAEMALIHSEEGNHEQLSEILRTQAACANEVHEAIDIYLKLAQLWTERLKSPEKALKQALDPALGLDPDHKDCLLYQLKLTRGMARWELVEQTLVRLLPVTDEKSLGHADHLKELADVLYNRLNRGGEARTIIDQLVTAKGSTAEHLDFAAEFYRKNQLRTDLLKTLRLREQRVKDPKERAALLAEMGWVQAEQGASTKEIQKVFRAALKYDNVCVSALWGIAKSSPDEGTIKERLGVLEQLVDLESERERKLSAVLLAADICREEAEDFEGATQQLKEALSFDSECYKALVGLAELLYAQEEWEQAEPYFKKLLRNREFGEDAEYAADLLHTHGVVLQKLEMNEEAASAFRRALEFQPEHLACLEDLGQSMLAAGAWEAAVKIFEKLVQRTRIPKAREAHELSLAHALKEVGEIDRALELYGRALTKNGEHAAARLQYALLLIQQGNVDGARVCFEEILSASGVGSRLRGEALVQLADLYTQNYRDATQGTTLLKAAQEQIGPHQAGAARRLAEIYAHNERWKEAAAELGRAVEYESDEQESGRLWAALGRLSRDRLNNSDYARVCFENAVKMNPEDVKTLDSLISLLKDLGDFGGMNQVLVSAIACSADQYTASSFRLQRAELLWKQFSMRKEAIQEYEAVLATDGEETEARQALARLYVEVGDEAKALAFHRDWLKESPLRVGSHRALAAVFQGTGKNRAYVQTLHSLAVLRAATPDELKLLQSHIKYNPKPVSPINEEVYLQQLLPAELPVSLAKLLRIVGSWSSLLFPADLKPYGLNKKNKLDLGDPQAPYSILIRRAVKFFALQDRVDVYWMAEWRRPEIVIEEAEKTVVMIGPAAFEGLNENEILFVLARRFASVYGRFNFVHKHGSSGLYRFTKMIAEALTSDTIPGSSDSTGQVKQAAEMVAAKMKPEAKRQAAPLIEELWKERTHYDFAHICQLFDWVAGRAGLVVAGGVYSAAEAQFKTNVQLGGSLGLTTEDVQRQLRDNKLMKELLQYCVSKEYNELLRIILD
jgi:tetratricopeptide (TPR) repeat protein